MAVKINKKQKALMEKAGFKATFPHGENLVIDPMVYWVRGEIYVTLFAKSEITLNDLIDRIVCQSSYRAIRAERNQARPPSDEVKFKYKND